MELGIDGPSHCDSSLILEFRRAKSFGEQVELSCEPPNGNFTEATLHLHFRRGSSFSLDVRWGKIENLRVLRGQVGR